MVVMVLLLLLLAQWLWRVVVVMVGTGCGVDWRVEQYVRRVVWYAASRVCDGVWGVVGCTGTSD